jgi:hypothetical protein
MEVAKWLLEHGGDLGNDEMDVEMWWDLWDDKMTIGGEWTLGKMAF